MITPTLKEQDETSQLEKLTQSLRSNDIKEREKAKQLILELSRQSPEIRQEVIQRLINILRASSHSATMTRSPEFAQEWQEAVDILGSLQATEAIDALIECLDRDDGISGLGPGRYPAALALIKIGHPAIPKLTAAMEQRTVGIRLKAAEVLYAIGDDIAKEALKDVERHQKDKQLDSLIRNMLRDWNKRNKHQP
jgi:thioredoxin-like negative regulator of GroEL